MDRLRNFGTSLLSLLALAVIVILAVLVIGGMSRDAGPQTEQQAPPESQRESPYPAPNSLLSPLAPPTLPSTFSGYPSPGEFVTEETGAEWAATATTLPDRGVRVAHSSKVSLSASDLTIESLLHPRIDGDFLVFQATVEGGRTILRADLKTGSIQQLTEVTETGFDGPYISENTVVWMKPVPELGDEARQLHIYDLKQETALAAKEIGAGQINPRQLDFRDNLLVWMANNDEGLGIYGYDLDKEKELAIAPTGPGARSFPKACSSRWVIYLQHDHGWPEVADLFVQDLRTGKTTLIGQVPLPQNTSVGEQHVCDAEQIAWVSLRIEETSSSIEGDEQTTKWIYEQRLYDLKKHTDRVLDLAITFPPSLILDDEILISSVGYDLDRDVPFSIAPGFPPDMGDGGWLLLSDKELVWLTSAAFGSPQHIYSAVIEQDGIEP